MSATPNDGWHAGKLWHEGSIAASVEFLAGEPYPWRWQVEGRPWCGGELTRSQAEREALRAYEGDLLDALLALPQDEQDEYLSANGGHGGHYVLRRRLFGGEADRG
jgi:hypothetical protein